VLYSALWEILAAPLEKWRVFLHPSQSRLVKRDWNGPVRILGGAGTGKTVVAMHRAKWLAEHCFRDPHDRLLFTTFTKNLAVDIQMNLQKICSSETMKRIKVENIDSWVTTFLKREGINTTIVYDEQVKPLWDQAYSTAPISPALPLSFYQDEWKEVIQAHGILTLPDYVKVSRKGRGTSLKRQERVAIWPVFEEYRSLLQVKGWKEIEDALRDACSLLQNQSGVMLPIQSILVDEAPDMSEGVFKLLRTIVPPRSEGNDLFIVGDPHQRIYNHKVILSHCGIEIRGRSPKLRINYRTTEEIRQWATNILEGINFDDLDGNSDDLKDYRSLLSGEKPIIQGFNSLHRVKGLQFEYMFLASLNQGIVPLETALQNLSDETARQNFFNLERSLIHVAATRAKQGVVVTYYGDRSPLI
jgi:superfamily I DNA/RNA helicase